MSVNGNTFGIYLSEGYSGPKWPHNVGMKPCESFSCSLHVSWKAAIPATIDMIMSASEIMDQMIPQQCEEPPYFFANTLASELLTLRRIRSSHYPQYVMLAKKKTLQIKKQNSMKGGKILRYPKRYTKPT